MAMYTFHRANLHAFWFFEEILVRYKHCDEPPYLQLGGCAGGQDR